MAWCLPPKYKQIERNWQTHNLLTFGDLSPDPGWHLVERTQCHFIQTAYLHRPKAQKKWYFLSIKAMVKPERKGCNYLNLKLMRSFRHWQSKTSVVYNASWKIPARWQGPKSLVSQSLWWSGKPLKLGTSYNVGEVRVGWHGSAKGFLNDCEPPIWPVSHFRSREADNLPDDSMYGSIRLYL